MSIKMTISCEANLTDVELEEGLFVLIQDTGKVFRCITGHDGRLTWKAESSSRYDFPEVSPQVQEIEFEESFATKVKKGWNTSVKTSYLH